MPTPILADNFTHRIVGSEITATSLPATATARVWSTGSRVTGISFDTTKTRDGRGYLKIVEDGTTLTRAQKAIASGIRVLVGTIIFRVETAPAAKSQMFHATAGTGGGLQFGMQTDGTLWMNLGGTAEQTHAVDMADDADHRLDFRYTTSGSTYTIDWEIDGSAKTQCSKGSLTATDISVPSIGSNTNSHNLTFWAQDLILSSTSGDFPLGPSRVQTLNVNGDGTHQAGITAGDFDKASGTDILTSTTDAWTEIDDWITGAADTTTYIQDTAGANTEYTEHTFDNTAGTETIWGVFGYVAAFASSGTACNLTVRIVDSGGTTLTDILANEDVSETTLRYWFDPITSPGGDGWSTSELDGAKVRIGLSTDVSPDPRCSAVMLQYAIADDPVSVITGDGALTVNLSGAADGSVLVQGDGAGTVRLSAAADGSVLVQADGAGTVRVTLAGTGSVGDGIEGTGALTINLAGAGAGDVLVQGDGAAAVRLSAAAAGDVLVQGDGAGTIRLSGAGTGDVLVQGDGTGTIRIGSAADGSVIVSGDGAGIVAVSADGTVTHAISADGSLSIQVSVDATGTRIVDVSHNGAWYAQWRRANTPSGRRRPSRKTNW